MKIKLLKIVYSLPIFKLYFTIQLLLAFTSLIAQKNNDQLYKTFTTTSPTQQHFFLITIEDKSELLKTAKSVYGIIRQVDDTHFIIKAKDTVLWKYIRSNYINNDWKLTPQLLIKKTKKITKQTLIQRYYVAVTNIDSFTAWLATQAKSIKILQALSVKNMVLIMATEQQMLNQLLPCRFTTFIELADRKAKEEEVVQGLDNSVNRINKAHYLFPAIDGAGLTVSLKEDLFDTTDIDFKGRYKAVPGTANKTSVHANTMATLIGGGGNSFYTGTGVATGVTLSSVSFDNLLAEPISFFNANKVTVQNHSYGVEIENFYGTEAASYDTNIYKQPELIHVFSVGNSGASASLSGRYANIPGVANITGAFKMAKNCIVVAAIDSFLNSIDYISKGPAYDGRLKPELSAFSIGGSSGAAAIVSGCALLVQQLYKQKTGAMPDAAMTKALLINSADDAGAKGIDFATGYGSVNIANALQAINQQRYFSGTIQNNQTKNFSITIPPNTKNVKVTLCWTDAPATVNNAVALQNDVDLIVIDPTTKQWLPWVLNSFPHKDSLLLPAVRKRDSLNNVEYITIDAPVAGNYNLQVFGKNISGNQNLNIAWQYQLNNTFQWDFPTANDNLVPQESNIIKWQNAFAGTGVLQWSANGIQWQTIQASVNLTKNYTQWTPPDSITKAQLRMVVGSQIFISDTFTISTPLPLEGSFNCLDTITLSWPKQKNITTYQLYTVGDKYLTPVSIIKDTMVKIPSKLFTQYYTVAPIVPFYKAGIKSMLYTSEKNSKDCYIQLFLVDTIDNTASLRLLLSTVYGIKQIVIEKMIKGVYNTLATIQPVNTLQHTYSDNKLLEGGNTYRVKLVLNNGQFVYSDAITILYTRSQSFFVFPNPVQQGQSIIIVQSPATNYNGVFSLYAIDGKLLKQKDITYNIDDFSTLSIAKGIYIYTIQKNGKIGGKGKLIIY